MSDKDALFRPIKEKVFLIRGQFVMLDRDLATLYGVETKYLNRQVQRNLEYFEGEDFMFRLTPEESSRCQIGTLNRGGNIKYMPYVFMEIGIPTLSSVLKCPRAVRVNRQIMRYFVHMRKLELTSNDFRRYVETRFKLLDEKLKETDGKLLNHSEVMKDILEQIRRMIKVPDKPKKQIGFRIEEKTQAYRKSRQKESCSKQQMDRLKRTLECLSVLL